MDVTDLEQAGGTVQAITREASGRIIGTATTRPGAGTTTRSSRTTYRVAEGRLVGSAYTSKASGTGSRPQYRDASGRLTASQTTGGSPGAMTRHPA